MTFRQQASLLWDILVSIGLVTVLVLQFSFPLTQVTVDDDLVSFKRQFPRWHPLKKYYLSELIIPHHSWDTWVRFTRNNFEHSENYYLFFKAGKLRYAAETKLNGELEFWVEKKFPDRPLNLEYPSDGLKFGEAYNQLKEKNRMNLF
jgi:hypothetical protein